MLADMHTHSNASPDADRAAEIVLMAEKAEELGLAALTVTDHCECNYWLPESETEYPEYRKSDSIMFGSRDYAIRSIEKTFELKERYPVLRVGTELGQMMQAPGIAAAVAGDERLDFILGSLHMSAGLPDFYYMEYNKMDSSEISRMLSDYFLEELECCRNADFDVLAHLTYPLRFIEGDYGIKCDLAPFGEIIEEIFRALIDRGLGLEINTKGLRTKYGRPMPPQELLKLYRQLGGEIITLGSDAHSVKDIGLGLAECAEIASAAGFRYTAVYEKRKPRFIRL